MNERKKRDPFHFSEHRLDQQFEADWATAGVEAGCQVLLLHNFKIRRLYFTLHLHTRSVIVLKQVLGLLRRCMTYFVFKGSVVALNSIPANEAEENKRFLASPPPLTGLLWLTVAVTNYSLLAVTRMYKATKSYLDLGF